MQAQSLYALTQAYVMLATAEDAPEFQTALDQLSDAIEVKADGIGRVIRMYQAGADAIQAEIDRLSDLKAYRDRRVKALKEYLLESMVRADKPKIDTPMFRFAVRQNPAAVDVYMRDAVPPQFFRVIPETREPDKKAMMAYMQGQMLPVLCDCGAVIQELPGARITRGRRLEIK